MSKQEKLDSLIAEASGERPVCEGCGAPATQLVQDVWDFGPSALNPIAPRHIGSGYFTHFCDSCAIGNDTAVLIDGSLTLHGHWNDGDD